MVPADLPATTRFGAVLADPPWRFRNFSARGEGRNATAHYGCLDFERLAAMPVAELAAEDAVLFLWVPDPMLPQGIRLAQAWGFEFKTVAFTWAKTNPRAAFPLAEADFFMGTGYWTRANPEQCLLATRGRPRRLARGVRQLVVSPRREHSRKPEEVHEHIERLCAGPYLELFARATRPG